VAGASGQRNSLATDCPAGGALPRALKLASAAATRWPVEARQWRGGQLVWGSFICSPGAVWPPQTVVGGADCMQLCASWQTSPFVARQTIWQASQIGAASLSSAVELLRRRDCDEEQQVGARQLPLTVVGAYVRRALAAE